MAASAVALAIAAFQQGFPPLPSSLLPDLAEGVEGSGPTVPPQWSADLIYSGTMVGTNFTDSVGRYHYDSPGYRYRLTYLAKSDLFRPNSSQEWDQLYSKFEGTFFTIGAGAEAACMAMTGAAKTFSDMFAWLPVARYVGHKELGGKPCDNYEFKASSALFGTITMSACIDGKGLPLDHHQTMEGKFSMKTSYRFSGHSLGSPGEKAFEPTFACKHYPSPPCKSSGVAILDTYRIWGPPEPQELQNRNTGDVLGDVSFVCTQASGEFYRSKLITHWSVTVDTSFGQYALCNFNGTSNVCTGSPDMLKHVGRRSSQMSGGGPFMGQCSPNNDVGSQYSFPSEARCPDGVLPGQPGSKGCAWAARPVRTVRASCVMEERGLVQVCDQEFGHAPFLKSAHVWQAAFESADPSQGGCPDADPSGEEMDVLLV